MRKTKLLIPLLILGLIATAYSNTGAQENQEKQKRYAQGSRQLDSRILVHTERYLKGKQTLRVSPEMLPDFQPDYVEFYLDGAMAAIDTEAPFEATIDVGEFTDKHTILIIAVSDRAVRGGVQKPIEPQQTGATEAGVFSVKIGNPQAGVYVLGRTPISVEAQLDDGARLEAVQFFVDDQLVGTADKEPFEFVHDFGRGFNGRRIKVVAMDNEGRRAEAEVVTAALESSDYYLRTDVVSLDVTVTDNFGKPAAGLTRDDFRVLDNGAEQEIRYFSSEERPLWVAVLVDTSGSMRGAKIRRSVFAAQQFFAQLKPVDSAMFVTFGPDVKVVSDFTADFQSLIDAVGKVDAPERALTPLNQAMLSTLDNFKDRVGRRALIVISDGADTASRVGPSEVEEAAKKAEVRIYAIGIRELGFGGPGDSMDDPASALLRGVADLTGGDSYFPTSTSEFFNIFQTITAELRSQYSIGYAAPESQDDRWRTVEIKLKKGGLQARTRQGYYPGER
jgi:Ca-activated chloride channel family protein